MTIISVVVGALLAGGFAVLGSTLGEKRGRATWLRDKRLSAAAEYLACVDRETTRMIGASAMTPTTGAVTMSLSEVVTSYAQRVEAQALVVLLGPPEVSEAARELAGAEGAIPGATSDQQKALRALRDGFIAAVQKALREDPAI